MGERTTAASDLYSLGIVAFELLTGRRPFEGDSVAAEAAAHVTGVVPSVRDVNPTLPVRARPRVRAGARQGSRATLRQLRPSSSPRCAHSLEEAAGTTRSLPRADAPPWRRASPRTPRPSRGSCRSSACSSLPAPAAASRARCSPGRRTRRRRRRRRRPARSRRTVTTVHDGAAHDRASHRRDAAAVGRSRRAQRAGVRADAAAATSRARCRSCSRRYRRCRGRARLTTGYANYNLGVTLIAPRALRRRDALSRDCAQLEPDRHEVDGRAEDRAALRRPATARAGEGTRRLWRSRAARRTAARSTRGTRRT